MSDINKTIKYAGIYTVGIFLSKAVSFIMLPIYTRFLTPGDYGTIELLSMTVDVFAMVVGVGLTATVFRFYYAYDRIEDRYKVISTIMTLLIVIYIITCCTGILISDFLGALILNGEPNSGFYFRLMFFCFFLQSFIETPMLFIKAQQRPLIFVSVSIVRLVLQLSFNIYFVVYLKIGVLGVLYSTLIASACIGFFLVIRTYITVGITYSREISIKLLRFGFPLIFSNIGSFILTFSDRYFLKAYADIDTVGIYSLGYKLGFLLWLFPVTPIMNIWDPQRFEIAEKNNCHNLNNNVFFFFNLSLICVALFISIFSKDLFRIMSDVKFWSAYRIVPLIMIAYIFQAWTDFGNFGVMYHKQTHYIAIATLTSAAIIVLLSFLLIPQFKAFGAAFATILAFFARFIIVYLFSQKLFYLSLPWKKVMFMICLAIIVYFFSIAVNFDQILYSLFFNAFCFSIFLFGLLLIPIFEPKEKRFIINLLRNPFKSFTQLSGL